MFFSSEKAENLKENKVVRLAYKTYSIFFDHDMNIYAGYATLYILMAMIPLLMLVITLVNLIPPFSIDDIMTIMMNLFPELPQIQTMLSELVINMYSQSSGWVASFSAISTLWSASNGVSAIQNSLNEINNNKRNMFQSKPVAFAFTILYVLLIPAVLVFQLLRRPLINLVSSILSDLNLPRAVNFFRSFMQYSGLVTILAVVVVITLTYTYLPYGRRTIKSQFPGALFTTLVAGIFTYLFSFFMGTFWKASSLYGSLAAIFLSAMWLKFVIMILFAGVALNKALEELDIDTEELL